MSESGDSTKTLSDQNPRPKLEAVPLTKGVGPSPELKTFGSNLSWINYLKILVGIVVGIVGYEMSRSVINNFLYFETTDDAQVSAHLTTINSRVGGIVSRVFFADNSQVKKGDILLTIDNREYLNSIKQIQAELAAVSARYWYAAAEFKRGQYLFKKKAIPQSRIDFLKAQSTETLAFVWAKKAQLEQAKLNLEFTEIRAPADGMVGRFQVEPGNVIRAQQGITSFVDDRSRWIVANFKETQLQNLRLGQTAEIEIDAVESKIFYGHIESIAPGSGSSFSLIPTDNATGNFTKIVQRVAVRIEFDPNSVRAFENRLIPGISAVIKVRVRADRTSK